MIILWIFKKNKNGQSQQKDDDGAFFQKHDETMKVFRLAHPKVEATEPKGADPVGQLVLLPLRKVKPAKYSRN
ncbi:MAG: hypothetical protein PHN78_07545 [Dehalococcoidales bacterium]|nr:hypothetical protein [Dehalococcoidales bacterium]